MFRIILIVDTFRYIWNNLNEFLDKFYVQIELSTLAILAAIIIGVPLGIWSAKNLKISQLVIQSSNMIRVIPSLAVLAIMIPYIGTGFLPALISLIILAIPTILINTYVGFQVIDKNVLESALAMGMNSKSILIKIEFPLALPVMLAGLKTAAVQVIAASTLAAFIGGGGLGEYILLGVGMNDLKFVIVGTVPIAILSLLAEYLLEKIENKWVV